MTMSNSAESLKFECPRCSEQVLEQFYGPCGSCREDLRQIFVADIRYVEAGKFEPKMNVTPNAVATKE